MPASVALSNSVVTLDLRLSDARDVYLATNFPPDEGSWLVLRTAAGGGSRACVILGEGNSMGTAQFYGGYSGRERGSPSEARAAIWLMNVSDREGV